MRHFIFYYEMEIIAGQASKLIHIFQNDTLRINFDSKIDLVESSAFIQLDLESERERETERNSE